MGKKGDIMKDLASTQYFTVETEPETSVKIVLESVYEAMLPLTVTSTAAISVLIALLARAR